jgi:hypothetical protein
MSDGLPRPGDIVVHRQVHSPAVYVLSRLDGTLQFSYKTYDEAVARAIRFASRESLDAWYTNDEQRYERFAKYRSESARRLVSKRTADKGL